MVFPVTVPILAFPEARYIPAHTPGSPVTPEVEDQVKLAMVLFWTLDAVLVPIERLIPTNLLA